MEVSEEGIWVPPLRKYSGVPSIAAFRRAALTPWNSQDSSSGTGSPPESPLHNHGSIQKHLFHECTKSKKCKSPIKQVQSITKVKNGIPDRVHREQDLNKEDENSLSVDRIHKVNSKNADRRRVKSSEPLTRYTNKKIACNNHTDGRDSIRLKVSEGNKSDSGLENKNDVCTNNSEQMPSSNGSAANSIVISCDYATSNNNAKLNDSVTKISDVETKIKNEKTRRKHSANNNSLLHNGDVEYELESRKLMSPKNNDGISVSRKEFEKLEVPGLLNDYKVNSPLKRRNQTKRKCGANKNGEQQCRQAVNSSLNSSLSVIEYETNREDASCDDSDDCKECYNDDRASPELDIGIDQEESWMSTKGNLDDDANSDSQCDEPNDDEDINNDVINKVNDDDSTKATTPDNIVDIECTIPEDDNSKDEKKVDSIDAPSPKPVSSPQQMRVHGINLTKEKLKKLRAIVDKAAQRKKVFTIFGKYPSIREALVSRGWIQNFDLQKLTLPHSRHNDNEVSVYARLRLGPGVGEEELALISRMLRDTPVHFVWIMGDTVDWKSLSKSTIVSRFPRVYFTTKVGLCSYLEESHWFCEASVSTVNFPRCYTTDDLTSFIKDFRLTACLGLIRTVIAAVDSKKPNIFSGKIPLSAIKFAVKRCCEFVSVEEHDDIDIELEERVWDHQWDQFLTYYYQLVHEGETFVTANDVQMEALYSCCVAAINGVKPYWPQLDMDGVCNLWLVKPGAKSRGRGISVCNKLERIMGKLGSAHQPSTDLNPPASSSRFVIQKYVERPLLIYNTKFDIRQWFLVTSAYPLTIWMYKESYLRFCSQLFSLSNLHESVHLTNNAVQCRYRNQSKRDKQLPDENMWDSYTFQAYLRTLGRRDEWESVVYPGMRESITGALLAAQDHMEPRPNCFELYGADFILTEDLKPWLIEINSSPAMSATTSVTARMCPQCLEDVIKVIIDRRSNRDAPTGQFELIYRQNVSAPQPYMGMNLTVRGSAAPRGKVPPSVWPPPPEDGQPLSHHDNIQTALDSLADHLASESDLLINSDERCVSSLAGEEGSKDASVHSERAGATLGKKRAERRCALYKTHSCLGPPLRNYSALACNNRTHRLYKKQMRLNSVLLSMRRVSVAPTSELLDWRQRAEHARALCSSAVARMTGKAQTNQAQAPGIKRARADWGRTRRSARKKKPKDKDRAASVDEMTVWNELCPQPDNIEKALSDNEHSKDPEGKPRSSVGPCKSPKLQNARLKNRENLSSKGKLYQDWKTDKNRINENTKSEIPEINGTLAIDETTEIERPNIKLNRKKKGLSPGRSPRSLSPSINIRTSPIVSKRSLRSSPVVTRHHLTATKSINKIDRSPSPSFRSLSPRVSSLTPGCFDLSCGTSSLEPNKFLRPFTSSDFNNNWPLNHSHSASKYIFKSSSMINLPALLTK